MDSNSFHSIKSTFNWVSCPESSRGLIETPCSQIVEADVAVVALPTVEELVSNTLPVCTVFGYTYPVRLLAGS